MQMERTALRANRAMNAPVLCTLLICDLAESTAMVEKIGDRRSAELMRSHDRLSRDLLLLHGGREIDKTDGFLVLFERPIRAVAFALEYQRQLKDLGAVHSIAPQARIGIHVGEIVLWENNAADIARGAKPVEAEGLIKQVAARLMGIARPGQILLSGTAHAVALRARDELVHTGVLHWRAHGCYRFKGVHEAVQVYEVGEDGVAAFKPPVWSGKAHREVPWWERPSALVLGAMAALFLMATAIYSLLRSHPTATVSDHAAIVPAAPEPSIAVLPFLDMSEKKDQEYFSDGLSEELIDHLEHGTDLKVIARTSSFQFKGKNGDVRSIARTLSVTHLLEGSVRTEGRQLRVTAQLIRGSDGVQIWSQTYDRDLVGIFKVQDEISERVAQALNVALRSTRPTLIAEPDIRAYNLVLEGNYLKARRNLRDAKKAAQIYQQAIEINPGYALAWARLASAYFVEEILRGPPSEDQNRRILAALNRAVALDPNLAWAYYTRAGFEASVLWDWAAARADTERVREIDPRFAYLPSAFGDIALTFGESGKAVELYQEGLAQNPLDPNMLNALAAALCAASRMQECLQTRLNVLQLYPEFGGVHRSVGIACILLGQFDAALRAVQSESNEDYKLSGLAVTYWAMGRRSDSNAALDSLTARSASFDPYGIASIHAYRGEIDEAFQWLDRAYRTRAYGILALKTDPLLTNLHGDPRFGDLLDRMGLTAVQARRADVKSREATL
jgi:TolB-like protein/class 3 adenylate cyclase/Tfp pilus assembly protein PilF